MKLTGIVESVFTGRYVFRGYATLANLAKISKPNGEYQREADKKRIDEIIKFLTDNPYSFFTELLFGLQFKDQRALTSLQQETLPGGIDLTEDNIRMTKNKFSFNTPMGENPSQKVMTLDFLDGYTTLSRMDGNHRLCAFDKIMSMAESSEKRSLMQKIGNTIVPFSILLLQKDEDSLKYEAAIFYLINSKSRPLTEEDNLKTLFNHRNFSPSELKVVFEIKNPEFTQGMIDVFRIDTFETLKPIIERQCFSTLFLLSELFRENGNTDIPVSRVISGFQEVENRYQENADLRGCSNIELICAFVYYNCVSRTKYDLFVRWVMANRLYQMEELRARTILSLFNNISKQEIKVFVAMPYYGKEEVRTFNKIFKETIDTIRRRYNVEGLRMIGEIMTYEGETINIVNDVIARIEDCEICFCDITDNNPNVTYEMGWARALKKHVVILKEESAESPKLDYMLDNYATYKKTALVTLEDAIENNIKAILSKNYGIDVYV